jgi:hypothetical protein
LVRFEYGLLEEIKHRSPVRWIATCPCAGLLRST